MNRQALQRTKVKDGFDPLVQFKNEVDENTKKEKRNKSEEKATDHNNLNINVGNNSNNNLENINTLLSVDEQIIKIHSHTSSGKKIPIQFKSDKNIIETAGNNFFKKDIFNDKVNLNSNSFFLDRDYITNNFDFIPGESLIDFEETFYRCEDVNLVGIIAVTDFRLIFKFKDKLLYDKLNIKEDQLRIPFYCISKIDKSNEKKNIVKYCLDITLKDTRVMKFIIQSDQLKLYANLNNLVFPRDHSFLYSFAYRYKDALLGEGSGNYNLVDGWKLYDPVKEYLRQGIKFDNENYKLRLVKNTNYTICSTYPEVIMTLREISDDELKEASLFRTKNRFPVLSYLYDSNKFNTETKTSKPFSYASIWRSSQTKSGLTGQNRSSADEKLLKSISQLNDKLFIYDARPYINALANRIKGGGFENTNNYSNTELHFCEIENIHTVRGSLGKVYSLCSNNKIMDNKKFWSSLEQTQWYEFIHLIIKYSYEIAMNIKKNYSVLVHCSDGWDRSSQLISLSEILIDPYYRSIEGLIVLIEKEWLSFGHQFALRNGIYLKEVNEDQRAPIFLQWLDCLHQLIIQFPNAFEFNMEFILFIANNYSINLYGTFMYNCEKERIDRDAKIKTVSIWTDMLGQNKSKYLNPFYDSQPQILTPVYAPYKLRFWEEYFIKNNNSVELPKIYLDYSKNVYVSTTYNYFAYNKMQDKNDVEYTNNKMNELIDILRDVYNKTINLDVYGQFNESTKFYLSSVCANSTNNNENDNSNNI